ncbi:MAG: hypothetical protein KC503_33945 [Myxococcales bacterium]|nr:hypothetical protein [Myxococcales bacterium]
MAKSAQNTHKVKFKRAKELATQAPAKKGLSQINADEMCNALRACVVSDKAELP